MDGQRVAHGVAGAANESRLIELMERTGYSMIQENGQRKFGGPPPEWHAQTPSKGCEVFVGKIPRDLYEDELVPVFEKIGKIYELRLMMDFSGSNRGYAFVMYTSTSDARRAVKELNNFEIRKGRLIGVCHSVDNCRLFVGGIPKTKYKQEIFEEMRKVTEGVVDVIVYPSATDKTKNRGFAFVEYENHRAAAMARRKLNLGRIQLWGHQIAVDWAEPEQDVDEEIMNTVKVLYVRNLMLSTTEEAIEKYFNNLISNSVERVKKIRDYAFVHFNTRENAVIAMDRSNGQTLDGSHVEVVFAKPPDKITRQQSKSMSTLLSTDAVTAAYSPYSFDLTSAYAGMPLAPGIANSGAFCTNQNAAAAMSALQISSTAAAAAAGAPAVMAPGVASLGAFSSADLLNRSLGHRSGVGAIRGRGRGAAGMRGAGATRQAYMQQPLMQTRRRTPSESRLLELLPGVELLSNAAAFLPRPLKSAIQQLEELCQVNKWGQPTFQLNSTKGRNEEDLYLYKVQIPALTGVYPQGFTPDKLLPTPDEAKQYAAEYILGRLQYPVQNSEGVMQQFALQAQQSYSAQLQQVAANDYYAAIAAAYQQQAILQAQQTLALQMQAVAPTTGSLTSVSPPNQTSPNQGFAPESGVVTSTAPQMYAAPPTHY